MKSSLIMLCFIFVISFYLDAVVSYTHHRSRLSDLLRQSMSSNDDVVLTKDRIPLHTRSATITSVQQEEEEVTEKKRDEWDSGEEHYFRWASLNRRPMESLFGRKRFAELTLLGSKPTRTSSDIWRSGLVG